ncbi:MAG: hypothetical protein SF052_06115 [Bacteroidia bacterium]|nr:hypothetical protein [Bacteroidia bacterium]
MNTLRFFIVMICLIQASSSAYSQSFYKNELTISPGIGAIGIITAYNATPIVINAEYGLTRAFSGGGYLGFRFLTDPTEVKRPALHPAVGARLTAHAFPLINQFTEAGIDDSKMDAYLSLLIGYEFAGSAYPVERPFIYPRPVVGGRYYLADPVALWFELGLGAFSIVNAGVTFRLGL